MTKMTRDSQLLPLLLVASLVAVASGQDFGDGSSGSIPQTFLDTGNAVQPQSAVQFAHSPSPIGGNPIRTAPNSATGPLGQPGPTNTIRETRIVTNVIREVPVQRTVPLRSHVIPSNPVIARQPLVQSAAIPPPVVSPTRRRSRGRRPVPSTPLSDAPINPCDQIKESGPCFDAHFRWAYNPTSGKCHEFIYGGCGGNGNQFASAQDCMTTCGTTQFQTLGLQPINPVVTVVA